MEMLSSIEFADELALPFAVAAVLARSLCHCRQKKELVADKK